MGCLHRLWASDEQELSGLPGSEWRDVIEQSPVTGKQVTVGKCAAKVERARTRLSRQLVEQC